jgi:hypothetical protein
MDNPLQPEIDWFKTLTAKQKCHKRLEYCLLTAACVMAIAEACLVYVVVTAV